VVKHDKRRISELNDNRRNFYQPVVRVYNGLMTFQPEKPAKVTDNSPDDGINDQAGDWFAKVRSGTMSAQENSQFQQWLQDNSAHNNAHKEIEAFWNNADFHDALVSMSLSHDKVLPYRHRTINNSWAVIPIAASIAFLTILLKPLFGCVYADYCTATGEIQNVQLADGSAITLSPQTTINVYHLTPWFIVIA
jgi:transmembrane sensor